MKYAESAKLLEKIMAAENILLNCHETPDVDSIASALAMQKVVSKLGKRTKIICPDPIGKDQSFFPDTASIEQVDFKSFDFKKFDLFIIMDSSDWERVAKYKDFSDPPLSTFVLDNHSSNIIFGDDRIIDYDSSSVCEMLFNVFNDWGESIDATVATSLYAGLIADTGSFQYQVKKNTFIIANELIGLGAKKEEVVFHLYRSYSYEFVKAWGIVINKLEMDKEHKFVWSALTLDDCLSLGELPKLTSISSTMFSRVINDTNFGIIMLEGRDRTLSISLRSRTDFDVSKIAIELGGGGHKTASGATLRNISFKDGVKKVLNVAQKYAQENQK